MRRDLLLLLPALLLLGLVAILVLHAMEEVPPGEGITRRGGSAAVPGSPAGSGGEASLPEPHRTPPEAESAFPRMPLPEGSAVAWIESLDAGLALAQAQGRLILLYVAMPAPT